MIFNIILLKERVINIEDILDKIKGNNKSNINTERKDGIIVTKFLLTVSHYIGSGKTFMKTTPIGSKMDYLKKKSTKKHDNSELVVEETEEY